MFTILGADGKEYGPATTAKVMEWMRDGRANLQTKARREGEADWKPLGEFAEFSTAATALPPVLPAAAAPAAAPAGPVDTKAYAEDLLTRGGSVDVFECLSRSFHLWTGNFLPLVGVTLVVVVVQMAIGLVPILGMLSGLFLNGVFYGGLYYYYLGKMRGEPRDVGDAFAGFSRAFVPLILASLIQSAFVLAGLAVFFAPWIGFFVEVVRNPGVTPHLPAIGTGMIILSAAGGLLALFVSISWIFTFPLVIDKGLAPWTAMVVSWRVVTRHWFAVFFTLLLGSILTMLGMIALIVGVLLTLPLVIGALLYAYESLCNPPPR